MSKVNTRLRAAVLEVVENQLRDGDPPETKETYDRLVSQGCSDQEARMYIGQVVVSEIFEVLKHNREYDHAKFVARLKKLPQDPAEHEDCGCS